MKYNININQKAIVDNRFDLDLIDAAILDFIHSWVIEDTIKKKELNGITYYWLDYKYMTIQMPMLGIKSKDGIYRRLKKMCDQGLLISHPENQSLGKPHFSFGIKFKLLLFKNTSDFDPNAPYQSPNTSRKPTERRTDERSDNNIINDNTIKISKKDSSIPPPFESEKFLKAWNDWMADRKERKKKLTDRAIKMQFYFLSSVSEEIAIKMIYEAIECGWQKFYPLKADNIVLDVCQSEMASTFLEFFLENTHVTYEWNKKDDNAAIVNLYSIFDKRVKERNLQLENGLHSTIINGFQQFLNLLNAFHRKRFLTPALLCKNFNTIIAEISHGNSTSKNTVKSAHDYV